MSAGADDFSRPVRRCDRVTSSSDLDPHSGDQAGKSDRTRAPPSVRARRQRRFATTACHERHSILLFLHLARLHHHGLQVLRCRYSRGTSSGHLEWKLQDVGIAATGDRTRLASTVPDPGVQPRGTMPSERELSARRAPESRDPRQPRRAGPPIGPRAAETLAASRRLRPQPYLDGHPMPHPGGRGRSLREPAALRFLSRIRS